MNLFECVFKDVADELRRIRPRVMPPDAGTIDDAIELLNGIHGLLRSDSSGIGELEACVPGHSAVNLYMLGEGAISLFAFTEQVLSKGELDELKRRCSLPLDLPISAGIEIDSIKFGGAPLKPVYSRNGEQIGSALEILSIADLASNKAEMEADHE